MIFRGTRTALAVAIAASFLTSACSQESNEIGYAARAPEDEVVYFVLPDRFENADPTNDTGGYDGDKFNHGFDPTHKGFYHGGDLKGLTSRLDYIQGMGATAIWLGPIYKNKPVQGKGADASAGYHGYWITDFTTVDPHFGTEDDMKAFVDAAHGRGMKVYLDIVTNHTADVIKFRECHDESVAEVVRNFWDCPYRSKADYPYTTHGNADADAINDSFMGDKAPYQTTENFSKLTNSAFAYTPYVPEAEKNVKVPAWLNDVRYYHNRGSSTFEGESSLHGDFGGLDDVMTENPFVVQGFIDIYKGWISKYKIDGFRVDTARHVNPEFWHAFIPAVVKHAKAEGIPNFYVFGEVAVHDVASLAKFTREDGFPGVLDFAFNGAVKKVLANNQNTNVLADMYFTDGVYEGGFETANRNPTFIGNHDDGRFGHFIQSGHAEASNEELLKRSTLAHALMIFGRGVPVIYYGDEQGFTGDGRDQDARENMFPSQVDIYNDNILIGTTKTTADENFDQDHPLYQAIKTMTGIYNSNPALRHGAQVVRLSERESGGVYAFSRIDNVNGGEFLIAVNTGTAQRDIQIDVDPQSETWSSVYGTCQPYSSTTGSYKVSLAPLEFTICRAK